MYTLLHEFTHRHAPFSRYTARDLWTRPHIAQQMLTFHLDQGTDLASRTTDRIHAIVDWLERTIGLRGKRLCDLGCGPGLYAEQFAEQGADVTGIDFSRHSLDHAETSASHSGKDIRYLHADYLSDPLPGGFDIVTLIYYDYCALSPQQRSSLLEKIRSMLNHGGYLVMDAMGIPSLAARHEQTIIERNLMDGFWAAGDYIGMQRTTLYPDEAVCLDHFLIIEPDQQWQIFNWLQYFTPERLTEECREAGFTIETLAGSLAGDQLDRKSTALGIIAHR